jgi:cell volume regulation protein A
MIFTITTICNGNGYLAVYIAGLLLGNKPLVKKRECVKFLEGIVWFLQIVMFVMLGLLVNPHEMLRIAPFALLIALFMMFVGRPLSVFLTLLPFKKPFFKARLFISWVGLRGATPIIFATYPVVENVPGADIIFNIVFFVTMLSLLLQGTTIKLAARKLDMIRILPKEGNEFGVELPEEMDSDIWDMELNENMLKNGKHLKDITLPKDLLVIMVKRGDEYIVPNGSLELLAKDKLLFISKNNVEKEKVLQE